MAHNNYYLDLSVEAFVVNDDAVLLRLHEKYDIWNGPGGHVDAGEDLNEAAIREVWEEVGLHVELVGPKGWAKSDTDSNLDLVPPLFMNRHRINATHEHSASIFAARSDSREINPQTEADVGCECIWVTEEELIAMAKNDTRLRPETLRYALKALEITSESSS